MSYSKKNEEKILGKNLRIAIVHDWLVSYRGGEKVLECFGNMFPEAPIYTLFYDSTQLPAWFKTKDIRYPELLNKFRIIRKLLLPFLPSIIESLELHGYDLILSTSSCVAKGVIPPVNAKHICYIHSPMRYIWDQRREYFRSLESLPIMSSLVNYLCSQLRVWDVVSASRVDTFVANSQFVRNRVARYYGRSASVVNPPVALARFRGEIPDFRAKEDYFLVMGALVPYKRFDLAIEACNRLGQRLVVAGAGPSEKYLRSLGGAKTEFVIGPDDERVVQLMRKAKALIYPGVEDFGISSIEAMACGTPVLALKEGGALDFIEPNINGTFFEEQNVESIASCLESFKLDLHKVVRSTERYSEERFIAEMREEIRKSMGV